MHPIPPARVKYNMNVPLPAGEAARRRLLAALTGSFSQKEPEKE